MLWPGWRSAKPPLALGMQHWAGPLRKASANRLSHSEKRAASSNNRSVWASAPAALWSQRCRGKPPSERASLDEVQLPLFIHDSRPFRSLNKGGRHCFSSPIGGEREGTDISVHDLKQLEQSRADCGPWGGQGQRPTDTPSGRRGSRQVPRARALLTLLRVVSGRETLLCVVPNWMQTRPQTPCG